MNRAKQLRLDRGLSRIAAGQGAGVSGHAIRRLEDGDVTARTLKAVGDFYGVQPTSLLLPAVYPDTTPPTEAPA